MARELLVTDNGLRTVEKFFNSWLGYGRVSSVTKTNVPEFANLRDPMVAETRRFLGEVVINQNGGQNQVLTANFTTPPASLATFCGSPAPAGYYAVVERRRGGASASSRGAVLATRASPDSARLPSAACSSWRAALPSAARSSGQRAGDRRAAAWSGSTPRQRYETAHAVGGCKVLSSRLRSDRLRLRELRRGGSLPRARGVAMPVGPVSYVPTEGASRGACFRLR